MNFFLVTFSLRNQARDYNQFFVALRGNALQWWHFIEQTCVITTTLDIRSLTNALLPYIEATDSLLIIPMTPHQMQGWLPTNAWEWLNQVSEAIAPTKPALPSFTMPPAPIVPRK
jgi:hypothetical protein